jgi:hypothetical protein
VTRLTRFFCIFALALAMATAAFACSGAGSGSGIPPVTGIIVRAETLTEGRGCGRAPKQLFKYAVVVFGRGTREPVVGNVYDCFADGTFVELKPVGGSFDYDLEVYAYNEASFTPVAQTVITAGTTSDPATLAKTSPTWTTKCTATQQPDVQSLALCDPLVPGLAGIGGGASPQTEITVGTDQFPLGGGRTGFCGTTGIPDAGPKQDAAPEGGSGDGGLLDGALGLLDAEAGTGKDGGPTPTPDAGTPETRGPVSFKTARIRWRTTSPARIGPTIDVNCPDVYRVTVDAEPAGYVLDVALLDDQGALVGSSFCEALVRPGASSTAVCSAP